MRSNQDLITPWLMYYWRSLFYTSTPTRRPIYQQSSIQSDDCIDDERETNQEKGEVDVSPGELLFQGVIDDNLAKKFDEYYQKTNIILVSSYSGEKE